MTLEKLRKQNVWFCWKSEKRKDSEKPTKVPYSALTGRRTGTTSDFSSTWTDYETASRVCKENGYNGIGFRLPEGMFLLDLDHISENNELFEIIRLRLNTYAEKSQSGNGVHFYGLVDINRIPSVTENGKIKLAAKYYQKHPDNGMELYFSGLTNRYAAFTGNTINDLEFADCTDELLKILDEFMLKDNGKKEVKANRQNTKTSSTAFEFRYADDNTVYSLPAGTDKDVVEVVKHLCRQKNSEKFIALFFRGDRSAYTNNAGEEDESRSDAALCSMIAFRTGENKPDLIERVFNASALVRDKWRERKDYRDATIKAGIMACSGTFHRLSKPTPDFIYTDANENVKVNPALLAETVRQNEKYFLVRDNGKQGILCYVYRNGCYNLYAPEMMKSVIKKYIEDYDISILKMKDVDETYKQLLTDINYINQSELNSNENIINFKNTLIDISGDKIVTCPHTPSVLSTIQIPCVWTGQPNATPVFDRYLNTLCNGDPNLIQLCLEIMGVCLSNVKGCRMKKSPFFYGDGDTGKSVLKALTERLLGQGNYIGIDLQEIEARFGTGAIYGMRLAGSSDMSFMSIDELKTFKKITGGDSLFAEFKGQQGFEYTFSGLLWFCMNRLPKFGGDDGKWVYERIMPIHCVNVIPKELQDKCLVDKMYNEKDGIVYKAVKALQQVIRNGYRFSEPEAVTKARDNYSRENNTVIMFFSECMEMIKEECYRPHTTGKIYDVYRQWCFDNNNGFAKTAKEFRDILSAHLGTAFKDLAIHSRTGTNYRHLKLTHEAEQHYIKAFSKGNDGGAAYDFQN